ncbi:MAG: hypothetical protein PVJ40_06390 [Gammaproteobacteria bacterium]|jgi:hypothetical protein
MIQMLMTFVALVALVAIFERKHQKLDTFEIGAVVILPVLIAFVFSAAVNSLNFHVLALVGGPLVFIGVTFVILWKILAVAPARATVYTLVVGVVNVVPLLIG